MRATWRRRTVASSILSVLALERSTGWSEDDIDQVLDELDLNTINMRTAVKKFVEHLGLDRPYLTGVWDDRDDPEGINYGDDLMEKVEAFAANVDQLWREREPARVHALGYMVQPVRGEIAMSPIETYPLDDRRAVMMRRAIIGDRFDRYDSDGVFRVWVNEYADEMLAIADVGPLHDPDSER